MTKQAKRGRAVKLLGRGAISRAWQALESKGLSDLENNEIWEQLQRKHLDKKESIPEDLFEFKPEEEVELKIGNILPKLDMHAVPRPSSLRNAHIRLWTGVYAPPSADEAVGWMDMLLTDMANDRLPAWFMHAVQAAELMALVKAEAKRPGDIADHRPVQIPNTLSKVGNKVMLEQC